MKIETKYDIGQEVWLLDNNHIYQGTVDGINIAIGKEISSVYTVRIRNISGSWTIQRKEEFVFPTKEELLKSL